MLKQGLEIQSIWKDQVLSIRRGRVGKGIANTLTTSGQMGVVVASYEGEDKQVYHVAGVSSATIFPPPMLLSVLLTMVVLLIPRQLKED